MPSNTSNQFNSLTSSNNGTNVQAKLQPNSHFYIESGNFTQIHNQSFGAETNQKFRTTAKVTLSGASKIYAICQGQIFIQPVTGDLNKINLILRPFKQPINGVSIKYFIYRGLNKSDFIESGTNLIAPKMTTGLTEYIWSEFENFYQNDTDPIPDFLAKFIGMPDNLVDQPDTDLIDKYFFKITEVIDSNTGAEDPSSNYEFPLIPKGLHLANATGEIGLDIVLNSGEYYIENNTNPFLLDLDYARLPDSVIDITSETDPYRIKQLKEACTQFLDPAAFFGMHANGAGKLFIDNNAMPLTVYTDIATRLTGFYSKNRTYIYIQSNRQRSYDFYENYKHSDLNSNTIKIGVDEPNGLESIFGELGWPIQVFTTNQSNGNEFNTVSVRLTTDNHTGASLFVKTGFVISEHTDNFVRNDNLLNDPVNTLGLDLNFSKSVDFQFPSVGANAIANFIQLLYEGKGLEIMEHIPSTGTGNDPVALELKLKDIDDVFGLINAQSFKVAQSNLEKPTILDERIQIINFPSNATAAFEIGAIRTKRVSDAILTVDDSTYLNRVSYETLMNNVGKKSGAFVKASSSSLDSEVDKTEAYGIEQNLFYKPKLPYEIVKREFLDGSTTVTGLELKHVDGNIPTKKILGITEVENYDITAIIQANGLTQCRFFFKEFLSDLEDKQINSSNIAYKVYYLKVVGENNAGETKIYSPNQEIKVYSLDGFFFFSSKYSEFVPDVTEEDENEFFINDITPIL